jgi:hypothetical protein
MKSLFFYLALSFFCSIPLLQGKEKINSSFWIEWQDFIANHYLFHLESYGPILQAILNSEREVSSQELAYPSSIDFEDQVAIFLNQFMGSSLFRISGYYVHPPKYGVYGDGEISDKVRITLVNGILNFPDNHIESLEVFASTHLRVNIHYIFRSIEGWSRDMIGCIFSKLGYVSEPALMLSKKWKDLIAEMGGVDGGGVIIHYAHSIGGSETLIAKNLLSPEEQKMIRVFTLGSASLIPVGGFQSVVNYVSKRDGVCLLDIWGFIEGLLDPDRNIIYIDTFLGMPLIDHPLSVPSYRMVIDELGNNFIAEFGLN